MTDIAIAKEDVEAMVDIIDDWHSWADGCPEKDEIQEVKELDKRLKEKLGFSNFGTDKDLIDPTIAFYCKRCTGYTKRGHGSDIYCTNCRVEMDMEGEDY